MAKRPEVAPIEPELGGVAVVAVMLNTTERNVYQMLYTGRMPDALRLGRSRKWRLRDIRAWINEGCPPVNRPETR